MSNLWIVIGREYTTRVKKKSFIILTILMPFLMVALVSVPIVLGMIKGDDSKTVALLDQTGLYAPGFMEAQASDSNHCDGYTFMIADSPLSEYQSGKAEADAVIYIDDNLIDNPSACRIYSTGEIQQDLLMYVEDLLNEKVRVAKMESYDIPNLGEIVDGLKQSVDVNTIKWGDDGEEVFSSTALAMLLGMISAMLIYMFVLSYGAMVMQSVMEEKTTRIVEVIVSCVKPFHLMMGKIIGVMLVGFTQIFIWGIVLSIVFAIASMFFIGADADTVKQIAEAQQTGMMAAAEAQNMPIAATDDFGTELFEAFRNLPLAEIFILFVMYFLGGYILYSSFYAAIGASINSQEDSSQFMLPMILIMIFALYAAMGSMENTDGPLAFWASLFPLTSPIVMMVRLPFGVPLWQEILSVVLLYATAIGFVWVGARIYRVGILMYGKKPSVKEMMKWIFVKKV